MIALTPGLQAALAAPPGVPVYRLVVSVEGSILSVTKYHPVTRTEHTVCVVGSVPGVTMWLLPSYQVVDSVPDVTRWLPPSHQADCLCSGFSTRCNQVVTTQLPDSGFSPICNQVVFTQSPNSGFSPICIQVVTTQSPG